MIKKIKIISLISFLSFSCGKSNNGGATKSVLNSNDCPRKVLKAYVQGLMASYPNNWHAIISYLRSNGIYELDEGDKKILLANQVNIERDIKDDPDLTDYFHCLLQTSSSESPTERDTGTFTTEKARLKQELYDDMANILSEIWEYDEKDYICCDLYTFLKICFFSDKKQMDDFLDLREPFFVKHVDGVKKQLDGKKWPLIFDLDKYKILGEDGLRKQIWQNLVVLLKNVKPIKNVEPGKHADENELKRIRKESYFFGDKHDGNKIETCPTTSYIEGRISDVCLDFGIKYDEHFTSVVCSPKNRQECLNLCLVFTTYILRKFVKEFKRENGKNVLECRNSCGLLSYKEPFCFLQHELVGLVWAIINTALCSFPIEKINPTNELCLDLSGLFSVDMSTEEIRRVIKNSLFGGVGFYYKDEVEEWARPIKIEDPVFTGMNGYATMDYRYAINFLRYDCFDIGGGKSSKKFQKINEDIYSSVKEPAANNTKNPIFGNSGDLLPDSGWGNTYNFLLSSFAALNGMIFGDGKNNRAASYYFFNFEKADDLLSVIFNLEDDNNILEKLSKDATAKTKATAEKWKNILMRERKNQDDFELYYAFYGNILEPLYCKAKDLAAGGVKWEYNNGRFGLSKCKTLNGTNFGTGDKEEAQNYFFSVVYRTYEAIGAYCLLDSIYNSKSWVIQFKEKDI